MPQRSKECSLGAPSRSLKLTLPGYLTPSLNKSHHAHWTVAYREKVKARSALVCALHDALAVCLTKTTSVEEQSRLSTALSKLVLSSTIRRSTSNSSSVSDGLSPSMKSAPK